MTSLSFFPLAQVVYLNSIAVKLFMTRIPFLKHAKVCLFKNRATPMFGQNTCGKVSLGEMWETF